MCCRHPLAIALWDIGHRSGARLVEKLSSETESTEFRAKEEQIASMLLEVFRIGPTDAQWLSTEILGLIEEQVNWPEIANELAVSASQTTELAQPDRVVRELSKLGPIWDDVHEVATS